MLTPKDYNYNRCSLLDCCLLRTIYWTKTKTFFGYLLVTNIPRHVKIGPK